MKKTCDVCQKVCQNTTGVKAHKKKMHGKDSSSDMFNYLKEKDEKDREECKRLDDERKKLDEKEREERAFSLSERVSNGSGHPALSSNGRGHPLQHCEWQTCKRMPFSLSERLSNGSDPL